MGIIIFIIAVLLLIGVPICINLCFKPENRWTAGNVLTYYGTTLSFLGTVTFSTLSIYHTKQIKEETSKREEMVKDMQLKMNAPILKCCISGSSGNYQNLYLLFVLFLPYRNVLRAVVPSPLKDLFHLVQY